MARFRICPGCLEDDRFIALEAALPFVAMCDRHAHPIALVDRCWRCGRRLRPFAGDRMPYDCDGERCGRDWIDAPRVAPAPDEVLRQRRILRAYRWLLEDRELDIVSAAQSLVRYEPLERFRGGSEADRTRTIRLPSPRPRTLAAIVSILLERHLPPTRLAEVCDAIAMPLERCLNARCGAGPNAIRMTGARRGLAEAFCRRCGSVFEGRRITLSFDFEHGDPTLPRRSVLRARARLVRDRVRLYKTTIELMTRRASSEIAVDDVFRAAGILRSGYLGAVELRLKEVVTSALHGFPPLDEGLDRYARLDARWRPPWPRPAPTQFVTLSAPRTTARGMAENVAAAVSPRHRRRPRTVSECAQYRSGVALGGTHAALTRRPR